MRGSGQARATMRAMAMLLATGLCSPASSADAHGWARSDAEAAFPAARTSAGDVGTAPRHGNARRDRTAHAAFGPASSRTGHASYYHDGLQGRRTSSGERYDRDGLTAAHRTLPLGTMVRVTNLANLRSVMVRVNDRGPFIRSRLIDLSRAAADRLGYRLRGSAPVVLEVVDPAAADDSPTSSR